MTGDERRARNLLRKLKRDLESPSSPLVGVVNTEQAADMIREHVWARAPQNVIIGGVPCKLTDVETISAPTQGIVKINLCYDPVNVFDKLRMTNIFEDLGEIDEPSWMPGEDAWTGYSAAS